MEEKRNRARAATWDAARRVTSAVSRKRPPYTRIVPTRPARLVLFEGCQLLPSTDRSGLWRLALEWLEDAPASPLQHAVLLLTEDELGSWSRVAAAARRQFGIRFYYSIPQEEWVAITDDMLHEALAAVVVTLGAVGIKVSAPVFKAPVKGGEP
jgi:hypothetical protein